ncbi:MAG: hypothetical protein AAFX76_13935 [Planctomycetota bacterium]
MIHRWSLITALIVAGLHPGVFCGSVMAGVSDAESASCVVQCCGPACCCVADSAPTPTPEPPATPPRGSDVAPLFLFSPPVFALEFSQDPGRQLFDGSTDGLPPGREFVSACPRLCRWLT